MAVITGDAPLQKVVVKGKEIFQLPTKSIVVLHTDANANTMPTVQTVLDDSPTQVEKLRAVTEQANLEAAAAGKKQAQTRSMLTVGAAIALAIGAVYLIGRGKNDD